MTGSAFTYLAHFYVLMLFSFSICLVFMAGKLNRAPTNIWICSNLMVAASIELFAVGEVSSGLNFHPIIFLLNSIAPVFKFFVLSYGWKWK